MTETANWTAEQKAAIQELRAKWTGMMVDFIDSAASELGFGEDGKPEMRKQTAEVMLRFALVEAISEGVTWEEIEALRQGAEVTADQKRLAKAFKPQVPAFPNGKEQPAAVQTRDQVPPPTERRAPANKKASSSAAGKKA